MNFRMNDKKGLTLMAMLLIFIVTFTLGVIYLGEQSVRKKWSPSECSVTYQGLDLSCESEDGDRICSYMTWWNVTYYNSQAKRNLTGQLTEDGYYDLAEANARLETYYVNETYGCYFKSKDFSLRWTMPFENYTQIGISALPFLLLFALLTVLFIFI